MGGPTEILKSGWDWIRGLWTGKKHRLLQKSIAKQQFYTYNTTNTIWHYQILEQNNYNIYRVEVSFLILLLKKNDNHSLEISHKENNTILTLIVYINKPFIWQCSLALTHRGSRILRVYLIINTLATSRIYKSVSVCYVMKKSLCDGVAMALVTSHHSKVKLLTDKSIINSINLMLYY